MAEEEKSHLNITRNAGVCIVEFEDRKILEEVSISEIGDLLLDVVGSEPDLRMVLSFRNVEHLSSAALGMLITLRSQVREKGGHLKLSNIRPQIYEVFKITKLHRLFDIHDTAAQAMQAFAEQQS
ncbi:MAG: STAS domain-containing protein [Phycisphaerales bacterium]|nr:MAG: STAS domain-containing protein [Phycisphaerales bacterium]